MRLLSSPLRFSSRRLPRWPAVVALLVVLGGGWVTVGSADNASRTERASAGDTHPRRDAPHADRDARMRAALQVLRDVNPELVERVQRAMAARPRLVDVALRRRMPILLRLAELRERDREMYDLRIEDLQLARQTLMLATYHKALEGDNPQLAEIVRERNPQLPETKQDVRDALRETLAERFEVRTRIRRLELARLEDRLRRLEEELDERAALHEQLIDERLQTLIDGRFEPGEFLGDALNDAMRGEPRGPRSEREPDETSDP